MVNKDVMRHQAFLGQLEKYIAKANAEGVVIVRNLGEIKQSRPGCRRWEESW